MATVLIIGTFDGIHRGHRAILSAARDIADAEGHDVTVLAFDPHPSAVLRPEALPPRLVSPECKKHYLREAGADRVELLEPTHALLGQDAEAYIAAVVKEYSPVAMVEGPDFRFGKGRVGNVKLLEKLGAKHDFSVQIVPKVRVTLSDLMEVEVSSSLVRWLVSQGRVADAAKCLGRDFELRAEVVHGEHKGRELDAPTANLDLDAIGDHVQPAPGVYSGVAALPDGSTHPAAISVGDKPTFEGKRMTIEAHLLDYTGDLYGQTVGLRFSRWLRDQMPFPTIDSLRQQIRRDLVAARECTLSA